MTVGDIILASYMTFLSAGLSAVVWSLHRRLEQRLDHRIDRLEERQDVQIASVRADLTQIALAIGIGPKASEG